MPEPAVVVAMRSFKADLLARELRQMQTMARRWLQVERALEGQIEALAQKAARIRADGGTVSRGTLFGLDRYHRLLAQLRAEIDRYAVYAADLIETERTRYARAGVDHAVNAIELAGPRNILAAFDRLPVEAVQMGAGLMADGSPLLTHLQATWGDASIGMTDELLRAIATGQNPRQTARRMADGTTRSLNRMLVTARTEQLRVYRMANREQMRASGVVAGYRRLSAHDSRVCAACLMDEGHLYALGETMPEHPAGRCAQVPVVEGMPELTWTQGASWFVTQSETTQKSILGKGRHDAWRAGMFSLDELINVRGNSVWGASMAVTPLQQLVPARAGL